MTESEKVLELMLRIIRENPGIRPSELNKRIKRVHSAHLRNKLIKQGLVHKERGGAAVHYYPIK
ncbi:MAG TPA: hypothetical protein VJC09_01700 [Candidatus Saccharimonadales bacterium]|nr:hypothetical protein [Candidatus Saccharimonadales bacterium]